MAPVSVKVGGVSVLLDPADFVQRSMILGVYEKAISRLVRSSLPSGGVFVNVGAHVGWHCATAIAAVSASGRVIAVEPSPSHVSLLRELASSASALGNRLDVVEAAASDIGGIPLELHLGGNNSGFNTVVSALTRPGLTPTSVSVTARRLDDILDEAGVDKVDHLLMDVEGHEYSAISGLGSWLTDGRIRRIIVEICPQACAKVGMARDAVPRLLMESGYSGLAIGRWRLRPLPRDWREISTLNTVWDWSGK